MTRALLLLATLLSSVTAEAGTSTATPPPAVTPLAATPAAATPAAATPAAATPAAAPPQTATPAAATLAPTTLRRSRTVGPLVVDVLVWGRADPDADAAVDAALDEAARVVALLDSASPDAPLARLNAAAGKDAVVVGAEAFDVLVSLRRIAQLSRGAYDLTAAVVDDAWGFAGGAAAPRLPARAELERARRLVSADDLVLDPVTGTARLKKAGARIDVSNVVGAYALDRARRVIVARGVRDFIISSGGDVIVSGQRGGRPWKVGVQDPRGPDPFLALPVDTSQLGGAVMTASDNESYFVVGDARYHSILDARTGLPATRSRSVTVLHDDALVAEALARAVFVLGDREGLLLIARLPEADVVIVTADNRVVLSRRLASMAAARALQQRPPTDAP
jgi:thiamine biosynthesis lipoprotein